jgi:hypothetical protein
MYGPLNVKKECQRTDKKLFLHSTKRTGKILLDFYEYLWRSFVTTVSYLQQAQWKSEILIKITRNVS